MTMRFMPISIRVLVAAAPAVALLAVAPPAMAHARQLCVPVRLAGTGQDLGADSKGNLHTTATISLGPIVVGTTAATFTPSGPPVGTTLAFTGPIVFTPARGSATVTAQVVGSVDLGTGKFTATSTQLTGSGALAPVSGTVTLAGTENLSSGAFTETITGRVCAPVH
jgi:hypothetical protein